MEVFADIACPFTHVSLRHFVARREVLGRRQPVLHVRAWPLELANGEPLRGSAVEAEVDVLRDTVAPGLFAGFDAGRFPNSTRSALASVAAAYRVGPEAGERFSLAVRDALFEDGLDVSDAHVLGALREAQGVGEPTDADTASVNADFEEGVRRGVVGSPHFFTPVGSFFCPSLAISHRGDELEVAFDQEGFDRFIAAALG